MPNIVNKLAVRQLTNHVKAAEGVVLFQMAGLTVAESEEFRGSLAEKGVRVHMVRNSLAKLALQESGYEMPEDVFQGNLAVAAGDAEAAIHAAKVCTDSPLRKEGKVAVRAGVLSGEVLGESDAKALADVPDRDTLNAQLLGVISGPARQLVGVVNALPAGLARVIQAHADEGAE